MTNFFRFFIRGSAFIGKELVEILRQTRLILTLVLGPFLIMLLFGLGYRNEARALRTSFVVSEDNSFRQQVEAYAESLGPQLIYEGITSDEEEALRQLRRGRLDLVVVVPDQAYEQIRNSQQAVFTLYHNEIDPYQASYVQYFGSAYIDEVNRRVLRSVAEQGQEEASTVQQRLQTARTSARVMREALERGDAAAAQGEQQKLDGDLDALSLAVGGSMALLQGVGTTLGDGDENGTGNPADPALATLAGINRNRDELGEIESGRESYTGEIENLREIENDLSNLETQLEDFQSVEPNVLVTPFTSQTQGIEDINLSPTAFFAPGVIVLLLQHLGVTFSALSIVRERRSGTMELFRISPISAMETLIGKYLSYLFFGGVLATIITLTVVLGLKIPMRGDWVTYALVVLVLLFTALGLGFLISLISQTETQAVQYAMFLLLGSVFFSGFFLDLRYLWEPIRAVSWALPATYGISLLQNIMLRGLPADQTLFFGLLAIGVGLFLVSWLLLRRLMRQE
jgi:ABC-2 type transport system permease protein